MKKYVLFTSTLIVTAGIVSFFFVPKHSNYYALTFNDDLTKEIVEKELTKKYNIFGDFSHFSVYTFISYRPLEDINKDLSHLGKIDVLNINKIKFIDFFRKLIKK
jgi:hypothetical protein